LEDNLFYLDRFDNNAYNNFIVTLFFMWLHTLVWKQ